MSISSQFFELSKLYFYIKIDINWFLYFNIVIIAFAIPQGEIIGKLRKKHQEDIIF